ncbi:hypothetical protein PIROE2DRAFT_60980 [Piromyces sp. E2]|nr:hypothetical protein PIROE2DRAFT_60980 [Piromyces sp. E2]|eukprot:OUM63953.1 hypothetical protein PIROE2DRAFT_60980 [Piromyces sp. E2]
MKSFLFALLVITYCIQLIFGITISGDTISQSINILKNELENNISTICPEISESLYEKTATDILFGDSPNIKSELAVAIKDHFLNGTEVEHNKRGDLLSRDACMKLCDAAAFIGAGAACSTFIGCLFAPVGGFVGLALCYNGC